MHQTVQREFLQQVRLAVERCRPVQQRGVARRAAIKILALTPEPQDALAEWARILLAKRGAHSEDVVKSAPQVEPDLRLEGSMGWPQILRESQSAQRAMQGLHVER